MSHYTRNIPAIWNVSLSQTVQQQFIISLLFGERTKLVCELAHLFTVSREHQGGGVVGLCVSSPFSSAPRSLFPALNYRRNAMAPGEEARRLLFLYSMCLVATTVAEITGWCIVKVVHIIRATVSNTYFSVPVTATSQVKTNLPGYFIICHWGMSTLYIPSPSSIAFVCTWGWRGHLCPRSAFKTVPSRPNFFVTFIPSMISYLSVGLTQTPVILTFYEIKGSIQRQLYNVSTFRQLSRGSTVPVTTRQTLAVYWHSLT